jgi:hypothetical protein
MRVIEDSNANDNAPNMACRVLAGITNGRNAQPPRALLVTV